MLTGLRVDVDTLRGTRLGVPKLLSVFRDHGIRATFYFSVGPDNMGRHLWRLLRPAFLWKMLRTSAPSLYGWSILRCGVIGRGPDIGGACGDIMRRARDEGHEIGLHAWDHQRWQSMNMENEDDIERQIELGFSRLAEILGAPPETSASPAWRTPERALAAKSRFPFRFNSDCRGEDCFLPADGGKPQVPVTLPTYDELIGTDGITDATYNARLLEQFRPDGLNVLCIHAEVEGVAKAPLFEDFLALSREKGIRYTPLGDVLRQCGPLDTAETVMRVIPGRDGEMCFQGGWTKRNMHEV